MTRVLLAVAATLVLCAAGCNGISRGQIRATAMPCCAAPGCASCASGCCSAGCASSAGSGCSCNGHCSAYNAGQHGGLAGYGAGGFGGGGMGMHGGAGMGHGGHFGACSQCGGRLGVVGGMICCHKCGIGYGPLRNVAGRVHGALHPHAGYPSETGPFAGNSGPAAAQVAYPYYTTRGPRDFLMNNPATIGR